MLCGRPLQVCARLFERRSHPPLRLRRLSMAQVEDFRQHGYLIVDGLLSREAAARVKAEALQHGVRGALLRLQQLCMLRQLVKLQINWPGIQRSCSTPLTAQTVPHL